MPARIDAEMDLHGYTAANAHELLNTAWSRGAWSSMRRVRIIHGTGEVLYRVVRQWAEEKSIPWTVETYNPGVTILQPALRRPAAAVAPNRPLAAPLQKLRSAKPKDGEPRVISGRGEVGPCDAPSSVEESRSQDLFALEVERLNEQDPRSLHKRKHGAK